MPFYNPVTVITYETVRTWFIRKIKNGLGVIIVLAPIDTLYKVERVLSEVPADNGRFVGQDEVSSFQGPYKYLTEYVWLASIRNEEDTDSIYDGALSRTQMERVAAASRKYLQG